MIDLESLLLEIKAKGYNCSLLQGWEKDQWQCNISLGSRLNCVCHCGDTPLETVQEAYRLALDLKPPEKKALIPLPSLDELLADLPTHNID